MRADQLVLAFCTGTVVPRLRKNKHSDSSRVSPVLFDCQAARMVEMEAAAWHSSGTSRVQTCTGCWEKG
jgi:hypothetical protein